MLATPTKIERPREWHLRSVEDALDELNVDPEYGLSAGEVARRGEQYGPNKLEERQGINPLVLLYQQFTEVMVLVLIVAAVISIFLGDWKDTIAILSIVILNAVLGFVQEYRAEQAMAALQELATPTVRVRRDGKVRDVDAVTLVPGDIVLLEAGSKVPADCRLVESANLRVQEASLTGESEPVSKSIRALDEPDIQIGDRRNMVYLGTAVTYGRAVAAVVHTGMATELGRIAELIQTVETEQTPLQKKMAQLGRYLAVAAVAIVSVVFVIGVATGQRSLGEMFLTAVAMAVAAVPEGLPAVVTIALALGAQRMLRRQALVRRLPAVETLGSVTVICSDKTGTLTQNRMQVTILDVAGHVTEITQRKREGMPFLRRSDQPAATDRASLSLLLIGGALANDAVLEEDTDASDLYTIGDPTEGALLVAAASHNLWKSELDDLFPRVAEVPFSSERKRMTTVHRLEHSAVAQVEPQLAMLYERTDRRYVAFTKGAVDSLLEVADRVWVEDGVVPLTPEWRERIEQANAEEAQLGLRVLGVAMRLLDDVPDEEDLDDLEEHLIFVGMLGMIDPPRPEVKTAVQTCRTAGIRPIMITGDHPLTALAIAEELEISTDGRLLTGQDLARMSIEDLEGVVEDISVYARVSPEHKLNIVTALQKKGHIVAMTGDGVNDAPALRKSDIGVAMGITGTDVSKEAANMVILDDNFATIVRAVKEGRTIYDNVRRFIKYTMSSNAGEIYVMLFAPFLGLPLPLTAIQILWINLVTDGLPGLALSIEPSERNTMKRPPYDPDESVLARGMGWHILWVGLLMGAVSLAVGYWGLGAGQSENYWQTLVFTTLTLSQMGHALAVRSDRDSLFTIGLFSNKPLLGAVLLTFVLQLAVVYVPFLQDFFGTMPLTSSHLSLALLLSSVVFWAVEVEKWIKRRNSQQLDAAPALGD